MLHGPEVIKKVIYKLTEVVALREKRYAVRELPSESDEHFKMMLDLKILVSSIS